MRCRPGKWQYRPNNLLSIELCSDWKPPEEKSYPHSIQILKLIQRWERILSFCNGLNKIDQIWVNSDASDVPDGGFTRSKGIRGGTTRQGSRKNIRRGERNGSSILSNTALSSQKAESNPYFSWLCVIYRYKVMCMFTLKSSLIF